MEADDEVSTNLKKTRKEQQEYEVCDSHDGKIVMMPISTSTNFNIQCFKKSFTTLNNYTNLFRGHAQRFELS
jgi:hypothetical protein